MVWGPGRWLVSLGNRQIVKSTAIADWQQKAGSWSAQRGGGGVEWTGVGREGRERRSERSETSRSRVFPSPIFSHRRSSIQGSYIIGCAASFRLDPNLYLLRPGDTLCQHLFLLVHIFFVNQNLPGCFWQNAAFDQTWHIGMQQVLEWRLWKQLRL